MKTILVPVELHELSQSTLQTAALLGLAFDSYLEGFTLSPALSPFMAADAMGTMVLYQEDAQDNGENAVKARQAFLDAMQAHAIPETTGTGKGPHFGWHAETHGDDFIGNIGRAFDITVLGRPGSKYGQPRGTTLEAALFESGRPVLIAPPEPPRQFGKNILIVWNGSTETARTIAFALPLLARADRVVVLTVEGSSVSGPDGADIVTFSGDKLLGCEARSVELEGRGIGETILAETAAHGSDLIIKGAYTQSRLRQLIFGGATREIIAETTLPVFMAH